MEKYAFGKTKRIYLSRSDDKAEWQVIIFGGAPGATYHWGEGFELNQYDKALARFYALCDEHAEDLLAGALGL